MYEGTVNWGIFDGDPESTCYCRCGQVFRSHVKGIYNKERHFSATRKPCPACGQNDNCNRISFDEETMTIGGKHD